MMDIFGSCTVDFDGVMAGIKKGEKRKVRKTREKLANLEKHMEETGKRWEDHVELSQKSRFCMSLFLFPLHIFMTKFTLLSLWHIYDLHFVHEIIYDIC